MSAQPIIYDPGSNARDFIDCDKLYLPSGAIVYLAGEKRALAIAKVYGADPNPNDLMRAAVRRADRNLRQSKRLYLQMCDLAERMTNNAD